MPGILTTAGAARCFKGGLVSGGVTASLHTATPPSAANKVAASWYGDQAVAEAAFESNDVGDYHRLVTNARIRFGIVPNPPGAAPTVLALHDGSDYVWHDDVAWAAWAANKTADVEAGDVKIEIKRAGEEVP